MRLSPMSAPARSNRGMGNGIGAQNLTKAFPLTIRLTFSTSCLFFYAWTKCVLRGSNCGHALAKNCGLLWDYGYV
jgi:hypothetical protein